MNIGFVSLGCPKNLVDSENMLGIIEQYKMHITNNPAKADVIIVNTCGFIQAAKEESINTILQMAEYKKTGRCKYLIVTGCLVQRYAADLFPRDAGNRCLSWHRSLYRYWHGPGKGAHRDENPSPGKESCCSCTSCK
jgi:tRNA A37 methylthiotransferase MiaB